MSSIDKLCLNWNEFQEKVCIGFSALRKDSEFADVTLACEDGSTQVGRGEILPKVLQWRQLFKDSIIETEKLEEEKIGTLLSLNYHRAFDLFCR